MYSYDSPLYQTIVAKGNAAVSNAADIFQLASPEPGLTGRVVGISAVTTAATTGAAAELRIGTVADPGAYGALAVPATAVDTAIPFTRAVITAIEDLPADTVILISGDGAATAGALDLAFTIAWS